MSEAGAMHRHRGCPEHHGGDAGLRFTRRGKHVEHGDPSVRTPGHHVHFLPPRWLVPGRRRHWERAGHIRDGQRNDMDHAFGGGGVMIHNRIGQPPGALRLPGPIGAPAGLGRTAVAHPAFSAPGRPRRVPDARLMSATPRPPSPHHALPRIPLRHFKLTSSPTVAFGAGELYALVDRPQSTAPPATRIPRQPPRGPRQRRPGPQCERRHRRPTESYTPVSAPAPGGPLAVTLTYYSEASQSEPFNNPQLYGMYGFGWMTNLQSNVVVANGEAVVTEENGSQVDFFVKSGSCPTGMQDDTIPNYSSAHNWCAADRVDAQFADSTGGGYEFWEQGGKKQYTYGADGIAPVLGQSVQPRPDLPVG